MATAGFKILELASSLARRFHLKSSLTADVHAALATFLGLLVASISVNQGRQTNGMFSLICLQALGDPCPTEHAVTDVNG